MQPRAEIFRGGHTKLLSNRSQQNLYLRELRAQSHEDRCTRAGIGFLYAPKKCAMPSTPGATEHHKTEQRIVWQQWSSHDLPRLLATSFKPHYRCPGRTA
jgi:hypothetical protein